jgi:hypothetical protein
MFLFAVMLNNNSSIQALFFMRWLNNLMTKYNISTNTQI